MVQSHLTKKKKKILTIYLYTLALSPSLVIPEIKRGILRGIKPHRVEKINCLHSKEPLVTLLGQNKLGSSEWRGCKGL